MEAPELSSAISIEPGLNDGAFFGKSSADVGDVDGDGINDLLVGASGKHDCDGCGAVFILFMSTDATIREYSKISKHSGGFGYNLGGWERFGTSVAGIGDIDSDGVPDIAVGAIEYDGGAKGGSVFIIRLRSNGHVKGWKRIGHSFDVPLGDYDMFGTSITSLGDLDGDGVVDIAVGATQDRLSSDWVSPCMADACSFGYVLILFLKVDGTVKGTQKITSGQAGFGAALQIRNHFGSSLANLGDLDGDGVVDLAVGANGKGAHLDGAMGEGTGELFILFLSDRRDGTVRSYQRIGQGVGGLTAQLASYSQFGSGMSSPQTGVLAVSESGSEPTIAGKLHMIVLDPSGRVTSELAYPRAAGATMPAGINQLPFGKALGTLQSGTQTKLVMSDHGRNSQRGQVWIATLSVEWRQLWQ